MNFSYSSFILILINRYKTGIIQKTLKMGSLSNDTAYYMFNYYHGTYIIATVGNNFYPHPNVGSVWGTTNNTTMFGLIWINTKFSLIDIEAYQQTIFETFPIRAFPSTPDVYESQFIFLAPASKYEVNGAYFTKFNSATKLYSTTDCNLTCTYCNRYTKAEECIYCDSAKREFLYKGECLSACSIKSVVLKKPILGTTTKHCGTCHGSCMNCLGPRKNQCSACCQSGSCGSSLLDMTPDKGSCS